MLKMKANLKQAFDGLEVNSAPYIHLIANRGPRVRRPAAIPGDPDSYKPPVDKLLDDAYLAQRADEVKADEVPARRPSSRPWRSAAGKGAQTTHFSVVANGATRCRTRRRSTANSAPAWWSTARASC